MNERPDGGRSAVAPTGDSKAERTYRSLLRAVEGGVARLDADGRIVEADEEFLEVTGRGRETVERQDVHLSDVMDDDGPLEDVVSTLRERADGVLTLDRAVRTPDGRSVPCTWRLSTLDEGAAPGAMAVVRERERAGSHRLQYTTSRALADASSLEEGLEAVVRAVCEWTDWEYGEAWLPDGREGITRLSISYRDGDRLEPFEEASEGVRLERGEGLPGRVLETAEPEWIPDVSTEENFVRADVAAAVGLKATLGVPVVDDEEVIAVLLFAMTERRGLDERLLETVVSVGMDLGSLVERIRTGEELERQRDELRAELDEVFDRIADGFYALDDEWRFTYVNEHAEEFLGKASDELLGRNIWATFPNESRRERFERAMETQEPISFEEHSTTAGAWFGVRAYPSESGLSVYFQDVSDRKERERELARFERAVEASGHAIYMADEDGVITYVNPAFEEITGYTEAEAIGESPALLQSGEHDDDYYRNLWETITAGKIWQEEIVDRRKDGERYYAEQTIAPVTDADGEIDRFVAVQTEVTERKERERELERQREQLASLNSLNEVVREATDAIIEQSTREDVEEVVCQSLAASESYEFAWIGDVDADSQTVNLRAEAGVEGYLEEVTISVDPDDPEGQGPAGRAARTQEMQVVSNALTDPEFEPWQEHAERYGYRSSAAIPVVHDDTLYGILGVYADRTGAFGGEEGAVISQLGEVVGHAIAAVEQKKALLSDEITELEVRVPGVFEGIEAPPARDRITIDRTVLVDDEEYVQYGTTTERGLETLEALVDHVEHWREVTVVSEEFDEVRFETRLDRSPILSIVTSHGGTLDRVVFQESDLHVSIHLPRGADVRRVVEDLQSPYPSLEPVARRQRSRENDPSRRVKRTWVEELTERQRTALEVAYFAGFFEWPRNSSGEEVARTLSITSPTFHQHVRSAENKLFRALFEGTAHDS